MNPVPFTNGALSDEYVEIERRFGDLAEGLSRNRELCPKCRGGSKGEKSFSVSRSAGRLVFNCYRASCGFKGATSQGSHQPLPSAGDGEPKRIDGRSRYEATGKGPVPDDIKRYLNEKYEIENHQLAKGGFRWTTEYSPQGHGRLLMPTINESGDIYGFVVRKLDNQHGTKTLSFFERNLGAWYPCEGSDELVIVEDQLSALRASDYMNAVALLGTSMSDGLITDIREGVEDKKYSGVFLALDGDAFPVSIKLAHKLKPHFKVKVIKLTKDLKDMKEADMVNVLYEAGVELYKEE